LKPEDKDKEYHFAKELNHQYLHKNPQYFYTVKDVG
jgi:hypothetical protein